MNWSSFRTGQRRRATTCVNIVVLQADGRQFGLIVDEINDTEEIVVKPLGKHLKGISSALPGRRSWATAMWP
ncbi:MAG: chemotaxis protein CheW [Chthoniobacteraceae bacterium]